MKIVREIIGVLLITAILICICIESVPKLKNDIPILDNVEMQLVEATIDQKYNEDLITTKFHVKYKDVFNLISFKGLEGLYMRRCKIGDKIIMYLNTMKDKSGNIIAQWLNMGN